VAWRRWTSNALARFASAPFRLRPEVCAGAAAPSPLSDIGARQRLVDVHHLALGDAGRGRPQQSPIMRDAGQQARRHQPNRGVLTDPGSATAGCMAIRDLGP
jgi:hypothetical protein